MLKKHDNLIQSPSNTIYLAGDMFDHKHILGNAMLAEYIEKVSQSRYQCLVPQDIEQATKRGSDVRNVDLKAVMSCDFGIFNFDGSDLDSGTVVEFMMAKFMDVPAVILRSDFRAAGDSKNNSWNLMADSYPRTEVVAPHSLGMYKEIKSQTDNLQEIIETLYTRLANELIAALDRVSKIPPLTNNHPNQTEAVYNWGLQFPGSGFAELCSAEPNFIESLLARKRAKGLL